MPKDSKTSFHNTGKNTYLKAIQKLEPRSKGSVISTRSGSSDFTLF